MNLAAAGTLVNARDFSTDKRKKMAKSGTALPDGSFPIANEEDVHNAVSLLHHAKNPKAAKAHIRTRAKALGMGDPFGEVKAGGPGSGRHPGFGAFDLAKPTAKQREEYNHMHDVLLQHGFKESNGFADTMSYQHPNRNMGMATIHPEGYWSHHPGYNRVVGSPAEASGRGAKSFDEHFKSVGDGKNMFQRLFHK